MDYVALRSEIENGPLAAELASLIAAGKDTEAAAVLNRRDIPGRRLVPVDVLQAHLMQTGLWYAMRVALRAAETPAVIKAGIEFVLDACGSRLYALDLDSDQVEALLDGFEIAGLIDEAGRGERTALLALGDTLLSRAEAVGLVAVGGELSAADVGRALQPARSGG